jgi:hypothetical protein
LVTRAPDICSTAELQQQVDSASVIRDKTYTTSHLGDIIIIGMTGICREIQAEIGIKRGRTVYNQSEPCVPLCISDDVIISGIISSRNSGICKECIVET